MQSNATKALGEDKIGKLLFRLATPAIAAQLINLLYNIVDRIYIGRMEGIGTLALTGVGICVPLIMANAAFAMLAGAGGAPRASKHLGAKDVKSAEKTLGNTVFMLLFSSLAVTTIYLLFGKELLFMVGASENTITYAYDYLSIYTIGCLFVQITLGLNLYITGQGFATTSMLTVLIGAVLNIILDPIFIFVFDMGIRGAALATIISQGVSALWILLFLMGKKTTLRIKFKYLKPDIKFIIPILTLGLSPFIMSITESLVSMTFNTSLMQYGGDLAVGAMTIIVSVRQIASLPQSGLTQGAQPIISYNYGANNPQRVKTAFKYLIVSCSVFTTAFWLIVMLFPQVFILIFNSDAQLVAYTSTMLRVYMAVSFSNGALLACQNTFLALGNAKSSLLMSVLRKVILLIPLIYILPNFFTDKVFAIFLAEPIADSIAIAITVSLFAYQFKRVLVKMENNNNAEKLVNLKKA